MSSLDLLIMAAKNLFRRKTRSILTILGIVIGTISIVMMVSLGIGMNESFQAQVDNIGSISVIDVRKGNKQSSTRRNNEDTNSELMQDLDIEILLQIDGVEAVSPVIDASVRLISGKYAANITVSGIEPELMEMLDYRIEEGRLLTKGDGLNIVFGASIVSQFREQEAGTSGGENNKSLGGFMRGSKSASQTNIEPFIDRISMTFDRKYNPQSTGENSLTDADVCRVKCVGILESGDMTRDRYAFMDIKEVKKLSDSYNQLIDEEVDNGYDRVFVKVENTDDVKKIMEYIKNMGYDASSQTEFLDSMMSTTDMIQIIFGIVGAVALLVAAIGITNTMVMAIYERRKEIGVMKVIGASLKDIKKLFLLEAAIIGFIGGLMGLTISYAASQILNKFGFSLFGARKGLSMGNLSSSIPIWLAVGAVIFTTLVGIFSGYLPAKKAMKLSALEAIKTE